MPDSPLHLFEGFGIELEYMIVNRETLSVSPLTDVVMKQVSGEFASELERGEISWSNELALHVIELKTNGPAQSLQPLSALFQDHVDQVNAVLGSLDARLMPTAMHPWMNPHTEMQLWPHEYSTVYEAFNRVFDCRGHGWANLQSMHINLPFADDEEFGRLHAAIRLLLPLLPALAASSPIMDGQLTGLMDNRLEVYRSNSREVPEVAGRVIPERAFTRAAYDEMIFRPMYAAIASRDPTGVLQDEFLNSRGAIARFSRGAIEIRVLDVQECPIADLAICQAVVAVLRALVEERWTDTAEQQTFDVDPLAHLFEATIRGAERTLISDAAYLRQFGWNQTPTCTVGELWTHLCDATGVLNRTDSTSVEQVALKTILEEGPLARRIERRLTTAGSPTEISAVYAELCDCLDAGRMFHGSARG